MRFDVVMQIQVQPMTPQQKVAQRDTDTVQLSSKELDQIKRDMDEQENLIKGYQVNTCTSQLQSVHFAECWRFSNPSSQVSFQS